MKEHHVRPRFQARTPLSPQQIEEKLAAALSQSVSRMSGRSIPGHATLILPKGEQHYWSPQLTLNYETSNSEETLIRGMYSPRPEVWTMFVLFYTLIGFATFVISIIAYSQWSLGESAAWAWLIPVLLVVFFSLYLVSFLGQRRGRQQMKALQQFLVATLEVRIE